MQGVAAHLRDPHRVNLRKAARAAIVVPAVFGVLVVTGDTPSALFAAFGCFAALVFADFGGPLPRRFRAYLVLAAVGAAFVVFGTACADTTWLAVVVTLVLVPVVTLAGALGGYFAAGGTAAILAFVLAVMSPTVDADLAARELGWLVGVVVAAAAAVALWPVHERDRVRAAAAVVLHEAAAALSVAAPHRDLTALAAADATLRARAGLVYRPAGSVAREHALAAVLVATRRLLPLLQRITAAETSAASDPTPEYAALAQQVAASLDASAGIVAHAATTVVDDEPLGRARDAHTAALERWTAHALPVEGATRVVDRFTATFPLRRLSLAALQIARDADALVDDQLRPPTDADVAVAVAADAGSVLRAHLHPRSVRFRNAVRAALGLALAVLIAQTASVQHAFWVVLGALTVLRSNALGTGATALQALAGAVAGFGVAALLMITVGADEAWLWPLLPIVVFLAAYTPGAVNFVVGQAGFTVFVVVLFNILSPEGWRTGLVRVQDVAIGAGISVVVGVLLWPRGARAVARRSFADLLRACTAHLELALATALHHRPADLATAAGEAQAARARAVAALEDLALERGGGQVDRAAWSELLVEALALELAAGGVVRSRQGRGPTPASCTAAVAALDAEAHSVTESVDQEAERLLREGVRSLARPGPAATPPVPAALVECLTHHGGEGVHGAVGLVWVHEWLGLAARHPR